MTAKCFYVFLSLSEADFSSSGLAEEELQTESNEPWQNKKKTLSLAFFCVQDWYGGLSGGQRSKAELMRLIFLKDRCPKAWQRAGVSCEIL